MNLDIKKRIDAINNNEAIHYFFNLLNKLIKEASLSETDERLAINVRNDYRKRFSVNINGRLILSIKDGNEFAMMINNDDLIQISTIPVLKKEVFEKQLPEASLVYFDFDALKENSEFLTPLWLKSCGEYLPTQTSSQYRRHHIDELYKIATNEEILNEYLNSEPKNDLSFAEMINEFRIYLKNEDTILNDFKIFPVKPNSSYVWIGDSQNILNDSIAHYEIILRRGKIYVEIHFEGNQSLKDKFNKNISDLPNKIKWFNWNNSKSIRYDETFSINDEDILQKLAKALLYLEESLGNQFREIKNSINTINVKLDFIDWMIVNDGKENNYFSQQFGSNIERFKSEIDTYEDIYKKDFNSELFVIELTNYETKISEIKDNIYSNSEGFSEYSQNNNNGRPKAILGKKNYIKFLNEYFKNNEFQNENTDKKYMVLNQILYGPPGTGKTYNTINKALKIINDEEVKALNFDNRKAVKDLFEKKAKENQIDFITFHQSMSYEDFIEGIKPETKNEKVTYAIKDGIFKTITKNALIEYIKDGSENESNDDFENLYNDFIENIKPFEGKREGIFKTKTGVEIMLVNANIDSILIKYLWSNNKKVSEGQHTFSVTKEKLKRVLVEGIEPNKIKNLKTELHPLVGHIHCELFAVYKKFYDFVIDTKGEIDAVHFDNLDLTYEEVKEQFDKLTKEQIKNKLLKPYVLIIDEINRGNVSQIFGELITLIEDSKRLGKEEALEVTLPYSKEKFGVPPNLYIIGTMNTADRSVEALDTALRRRFSFVEMMPNEKIFDSLNFSDTYDRKGIMQKINQRIEVLLDRNYTLGHSYFIKEDFKNSFENEIIPLLQEYFYNDYGKIGLVLGKGFVREKAITAKNDKSIFADFDTKNEVDINKSYELIPFTEINFDEAIQILLA
ncbi:McrB family protein [Flavobacterium sp.]|uniref:McrB family protein n=1 Tax=Flavobacterium sp. TaxID=239 RepID=UPI004047C65D